MGDSKGGGSPTRANKGWEWFGKMAAVLALIVTIVNLCDRFSGPSLTAAMSHLRPAPSPDSRNFLNSIYLRSKIVRDLETLKKDGKSADQVFAQIESDLKTTDISSSQFLKADFVARGMSFVDYFCITNDSEEVAEDVQIVLQGKGTAFISNIYYIGNDGPFIEWENRVRIGDLGPHANKFIWVWNDDGPSYPYPVKPAILFKNGTARVRESHEFFGWDSDLAYWFISQSAIVRYSFAAVAGLAIASIGYFLTRKKKRIPKKHGNPNDNAIH